MKKRFLSLAAAAALALSLCGGAAFALEERASKTISFFSISTPKASNAGEFKISYDVQANNIADEVGISSIVIYKESGSHVSTIIGTTGNGLIRTDASRHKSSYTYTGDAGESYFAVVTCVSTIGSDTDYRSLTTNIVTTPS